MALFGNDGITSFLFLILFFIFYPRIYIWQMIYKLETDMRKLESYAGRARRFVFKGLGRPDAKTRRAVEDFMEFFIVEPSSLDPYGIVGKLKHVIDNSERKINQLVSEIAPKAGSEQRANLNMGLKGSLTTDQIFRVVRHFVIMTKKMNNLQFAMILQFQMPLLMRIARAQVKATRAMVNGIPIGDTIAPMVAASFKTRAGKEIAEDVLASREKIEGKDVFVVKAKGPGGRLGKLGDAVERLIKRERIKYIVIVDAKAKLEGEQTGKVAEGVGVAIGGIGTERFGIEELAARQNIPVDAIGIKQSMFEASMPMKNEIFKSLEEARAAVKRRIREAKQKKVILVGVGNTVGCGNTRRELKGVDKLLRRDWREYAREKKEKARRGFF